MAEQYTSREARRRAAMADALMQNAIQAPRGGMVGRYYVGEGIGGGMSRIGQALLARGLNKRADEEESQFVAGQKAKRESAMRDLVAGVSARDESQTIDDGLGTQVLRTREPTNQEIGAALLKYQNETGQELPRDVLGLFAPDAAFSGTNPIQFGAAVVTEDDQGGLSFQVPQMDRRSKSVTVQSAAIPGTIANRNTGKTAEGAAALEVKTEAQKSAEKLRQELAAADDLAKAAGKVESAKQSAKLASEQAGERTKAALSASQGAEMIQALIVAIEKTPESAFGRGYENFVGMFGAGDKNQQNAMAEMNRLAVSLAPFATKEPGPSTDRDVINYMAQMGAVTDWHTTKEARLNSAREALRLLEVIQARYGVDWKPDSQNVAQPVGRDRLKSLIPGGAK